MSKRVKKLKRRVRELEHHVDWARQSVRLYAKMLAHLDSDLDLDPDHPEAESS